MACAGLLRALPPLLLLFSPLPPVRGQMYITGLPRTMIVDTEPLDNVATSCHCKVMCFVRLDCLAATFDDSDSTCHISTGPQTSITTTDLTSGTSWFKFVYPLPTIFLSQQTTQLATLANLIAACAAEGGVPANLLTQEHKNAAVALVADLDVQFTQYYTPLRWAWLIAMDSNSDGAFEWSDGTPVTETVFTAADFTGHGASAMLQSDGKIYLSTPQVRALYPVVCLTQ